MNTKMPSAIAKTTARATRIIILFFELPATVGVCTGDDGVAIGGVCGGVCGGVIGGVVGFGSGAWFNSGFISFLLTILYVYSIQVSEEPGYSACVTARLWDWGSGGRDHLCQLTSLLRSDLQWGHLRPSRLARLRVVKYVPYHQCQA